MGSFLNVLMMRVARGEDWVKKPSHCEKCQEKLAWYDKLPLLSFIFLRGKCRRCGEKIDAWHLVMELLGGGTLVLWWKTVVVSWMTVISLGEVVWQVTGSGILLTGAMLVAMLALLGLIVADLRFFLLPDVLVLSLAGAGLIWIVVALYWGELAWPVLLNGLLAAVLAAGFFWLLDMVAEKIWRRPGMGAGDVKLVAVLVLWLIISSRDVARLWWQVGAMLLLAFVSGAVVGILRVIFDLCKDNLLLKLSKKSTKSRAVAKKQAGGQITGRYLPFGPFLIFGFLSSFLWCEVILNWWLTLFS